MRYLLFTLILNVYAIGMGQTYYLTGRPTTFERNNAIKEVGMKWAITVMYAGSDVVEQMGLEAINKEIERADSLIALRKGKDWLGSFYSEVDATQATLDLIRQHLYNAIQTLSPPKNNAPFEEQKIIIHQLKRRTYQASIVSITDNHTATCKATYFIKWNRMKKMKLQVQCELPYQFPENGIIIK
jgi:hypothetical protein